ncbi:MAG: hypothetical protein AB7P03_30525, partial [Kofleriaceae bacterium]
MLASLDAPTSASVDLPFTADESFKRSHSDVVPVVRADRWIALGLAMLALVILARVGGCRVRHEASSIPPGPDSPDSPATAMASRSRRPQAGSPFTQDRDDDRLGRADVRPRCGIGRRCACRPWPAERDQPAIVR